MRIDFQGLNDYTVDPTLIEYAQPRLESLGHFSDRLRDIRMTVEYNRGRFTIEITCDVDGLVLRSETVNSDQLQGFDEALDRVERQLVRYKQKLVRRRKQGPHRGEPTPGQSVAPAPEPEPDEETDELEEFNIVRVKAHELKPMSPQEAVLQMEMVGHDFYVFYDDTVQRVGVVYKRKNGDYGLIEPGYPEE